MTYKCREFYCTKSESWAPPLFVWGNCKSQGFGIVTTTEQDPNTVGRWRLKNDQQHMTIAGFHRKGKLGLINLPAAFWKSWHPNICNDAACMFLFLLMLMLLFYYYYFLFVFRKKKAYCSNGQQNFHSSTGWPHEKLLRRCARVCFPVKVYVFMFVCVRVVCVFSWGTCPIFNLEQPIINRNNSSTTLRYRLVSGNKWNMHRLS